MAEANVEARVLVTYDCLHYALIPTTKYNDPSTSYSIFTEKANTADEDIIDYAAASHHAIPGKCPIPSCTHNHTFATLYSTLTSRLEFLTKAYEACRHYYYSRGRQYHLIDPLIRARHASDPRCTLINKQFSAETRHWGEDTFFQPFSEVAVGIYFTQGLIAHIESEIISDAKLSGDDLLSDCDRECAAQLLNLALHQGNKMIVDSTTIDCELQILINAEKENDAAFQVKQHGKYVAWLKLDRERRPDRMFKQNLIPWLDGKDLQEHMDMVMKERLKSKREQAKAEGSLIVESPGEYMHVRAAVARMRGAWMERMRGFDELDL